MPGPVLILGGYGNFGKRIAEALVNADIQVVIAGRHEDKARALARQLGHHAGFRAFDVHTGLNDRLAQDRPAVVINTCGPFQGSDYQIAQTCISHGIHYVDLADGRDFVTGIDTLDDAARQAGISVVSGASTVPTLSAAVLNEYAPCFQRLTRVRYGISPGQQAERGLATTQGIMTYVGKPISPHAGQAKPRYGWQDIYRQPYPGLGKRWMANCDIPDLDMFADRYKLEDLQFSAGIELSLLHLGTWALSWCVRLGLPINLPGHASALLRTSNWFDGFGSADGGMHVTMTGLDEQGDHKEITWFIIALDGDGPYIPTIPAVTLAKRFVAGITVPQGAYPCMDVISLDDYLHELDGRNIQTFVQ